MGPFISLVENLRRPCERIFNASDWLSVKRRNVSTARDIPSIKTSVLNSIEYGFVTPLVWTASRRRRTEGTAGRRWDEEVPFELTQTSETWAGGVTGQQPAAGREREGEKSAGRERARQGKANFLIWRRPRAGGRCWELRVNKNRMGHGGRPPGDVLYNYKEE